MTPTLLGLHHVTAVTADAQVNYEFYTGVLGLRLVKLTVNFDDPTSYHLYYGDELGHPGSVMTFFAWPGAPRGRLGPPQVLATAFAIPAEAVEYWAGRLKEFAVPVQPVTQRLGEPVLVFADPDGLAIELVGTTGPAVGTPWAGGGVPAERAIRGFHSVTLAEEGYESTAQLLTGTMAFHAAGEEANRFRYRAAGDGPAGTVDLLCVPDARRGALGAGVVHHVAFRTPDDAEQLAWRAALVGRGFNVTPVMDRNYFHSIYYREPGGVLFEIATVPPGFTRDEPAERLGTGLRLPAPLEPLRSQIEPLLPPLTLAGR